MNPANININRWCGAKRCEMSLRIYEALRKQGLTGKSLAEQLGISRQSVSQTINGINHSQRILDALRELGVSEKYLFDPRKVEIDLKLIRRVA